MDIEADLADLRDKQSSFDDMQSKLEDLELAITEVARLNEFQESSYADDDDDDALEINLPQVTASRSSVTAGAARVSLSKPNNDSHSSMIPIPNSSNTNPDGRNVSILDRRRSKLLSNFTFLDNNHRKSSSGAEFPQIRKSGGTMRQTSMKKFVAQEEFNNHSADVFNKIAALGKLVGIATHATALQQGFTVLDRVHQTYSRFRLGRAWWKWKIEWEEFNDLKDADNQVRGREFSAIVCPPIFRVLKHQLFVRWTQATVRMRNGIRLRLYLKRIIQQWLLLIRPSKREWFNKWRRTARLMSFQLTQTKVL